VYLSKQDNSMSNRLRSFKMGLSCIAVFLALASGVARAQSYSIDWFTIDGGGGTSTGGVYSVSGTIGQPDAGHMSGGNYTLDGGFWGIIAAVQTQGAPTLRVVLTSTNTVVVAWPYPSTGFSLQQNPIVNVPASWTNVPNPITQVGGENQVIVAPPAGNRFFRLKSP
jgi:hypothetical protein